MEQTERSKLIGGAPGNDAAIVAGHIVVIVVIRTFGDFFFEEALIGQGGLFDDGSVQDRAEDVRFGAGCGGWRGC